MSLTASTLYGVLSGIHNIFSKAGTKVGEAGDKLSDAEKAADWKGRALPSLTETIQPLVVEPRAIVSPELLQHEKIKDVLTVMSNNFAVYYFQAFNILGNVDNIRAIGTINDLSSIKRRDFSKVGGIAIEELSDDAVSFSTEDTASLKGGVPNIKDVNLATGQLINLTVRSQDGTTTVDVPIAIKVGTVVTSRNIIKAILGLTKLEAGLLSRLDKLLSGEISFFKDFLFAQDLIKEHKKLLMKDNTGMYADVMGRVSSGLRRYYTKGVKGYGAYYNMVVISASAAREIEASLGGKLISSRHRNKLFARNYVMFLVVLDDDRQSVTFYTRDMDTYNSIGYNALKNGKDSSSDLMALFKKMMVGG